MEDSELDEVAYSDASAQSDVDDGQHTDLKVPITSQPPPTQPPPYSVTPQYPPGSCPPSVYQQQPYVTGYPQGTNPQHAVPPQLPPQYMQQYNYQYQPYPPFAAQPVPYMAQYGAPGQTPIDTTHLFGRGRGVPHSYPYQPTYSVAPLGHGMGRGAHWSPPMGLTPGPGNGAVPMNNPPPTPEPAQEITTMVQDGDHDRSDDWTDIMNEGSVSHAEMTDDHSISHMEMTDDHSISHVEMTDECSVRRAEMTDDCFTSLTDTCMTYDHSVSQTEVTDELSVSHPEMTDKGSVIHSSSLISLHSDRDDSISIKTIPADDGNSLIDSPVTQPRTGVLVDISDNETMNSPETSLPTDDKAEDNSILVHGVLGIIPDTLELYFESSKKCDGGDIEKITVNEEEDTALIEYNDAKVAAQVIARGPTFKLGSKTLTVERPPKPDPCSILVQGISPTTHTDTLVMFFENKKRAGGGDIVNCQHEKGSDQATITFEDVEIAKTVLSWTSHELEGSRLTVIPAPVTSQTTPERIDADLDEIVNAPDPKVVYVQGKIQDVHKDTLELYLENKKYGGGPIECFTLDVETGRAVVTYEDPEDARGILQVGQLTIGGTVLTLHPDERKRQVQTKKAHPVMARSTRMASRASGGETWSPDQLSGLAVQIIDLPKITKKYLKLEIENESGGKDVDVKMYDEDKMAVVRFKRPSDVVRLLNKAALQVDDSVCSIIPLDTTANDKAAGSLGIMVTGLTADINIELLDMYFSNRRKSGGYDIKSPIFRKDEKAVITFQSPDAVRSVLGMQDRSRLSLKNKVLQVMEMEPLPPPPLIRGPTEPHKLIMIGAPSVTKEQLEAFLSGLHHDPENVQTDGTVSTHHGATTCMKRIAFGFQNHAILIEFPSMPDYHDLQLICATTPLQDRMVCLQKVPLPTMIQVRDVANLDAEDLELYFENKRSGGSEIKGGISFHHSKQCATIDYQDATVVKSVLRQSTSHQIRKQTIEVQPFYPAFGVSPPGHDSSRPWNVLPDPFIFAIQDPYILKFLSNQKEAMDLFTDVGRIKGFRICLAKSDDNGLLVCGDPDESGQIPGVARWEEICRAELEKLCDTILVQRINTVAECFPEICQAAKNITTLDILWDVDKEHSMMIFVGWEPEVRQICETLKSIISEVEDRLTRQSQSISDTIQLRHVEVILFKSKRYDDFHQRFPNIEVKILPTHLTLKGLPEEIKSAKLYLYEQFRQSMKSVPWDVSPERLKISQKKEVRSFIISKFGKVTPKVCVAWEPNGTELILHAMSDDDLKVGKDIMTKNVLENRIPLRDENIAVLSCKAWSDLKAKLRTDHGDVFILEEDIANCIIKVVVTSNVCDGLLEDIRNCLDENSILEKQLQLLSPVFDLLSAYYQGKIDAIVNTFKTYMVTIKATKGGYVIKGTKYGIQPALKSLEELSGKVASADHRIDKPGMGHYFHSSKGIDAVKALQIHCKAICVDPTTIQNHEVSRTVSSVFNTRTDELFTCQIQAATVKVVTGDITASNVDVIVNAANGQLMHAGGLAGAIVKAGGQSIQDECTLHMKNRSELLPGQVYTSASGTLPCKLIIHAVGPKWRGGRHGEPNELYEAVTLSLEATDQAGMQSIALPAISSGIFGFPISESTKTICEAVVDYLKKNSNDTSIREVHLTDNRAEGTKSFKASLEANLSQTRISDSRSKQPLSTGQKILNFFTGSGNTSSKSQPVTMGATNDILQTAEGISISIKRGSIPDEQVDVIVNTTSDSLNLSSGAVSQALLQKAGAIIQQECTNNAPSALHAGDIVVTSGGALQGVQNIFHGHCGHWDGGKHLNKFVSNALNEANKLGLSSIAFPAIGTGNLQYPRDDVADKMVAEVVKFSTKNPTTSLKDIRVVLFPKDTATIQAFEDHWRSVTSSGGGARSKTRKMEKKTSDDGKKKDMRTGQLSSPVKYSLIREHADKLTGKIEQMVITLKKGDLTKEKVDVIVNSTGQHFDVQGAVSRAIAKAGGPDIAKECQIIMDTSGQLHDVALTGAGKLPAKKVLHINATQSVDDWETLLFKALKATENNGMNSLAMPAVGTASLQRSHESMASVILKAVAKFTVEQKPQNLNAVYIVIYDPPVFAAFKKYMSAEFRGTGSGFLSTMLGSSSERPMSAEDAVVYRIFAMDQATIETVMTKLDKLCRDEVMRHVFDGHEEQKLIAKMNTEHVAKIERLRDTYQVTIEIENGHRLNRIIVEGYSAKVIPCVIEVGKIIQEIQNENDQDKVSALIYKQVRWQFYNGKAFTDYPQDINYLIETAYLDKKKKVEWSEDKGSIKLFFNTMMERQNDDGTTDVEVKRNGLGSSGSSSAVQLPKTWSTMQPGQNHTLVPLNAASAEYQKVAQPFTPGNIKSIERLQNPHLYQMYALRKVQMDDANKNVQNEHIMYHGTAFDGIVNINQGGFNRSYCGKNATAYGNGVYFAQDPNYSASPQYARPDTTGIRHIYQSRVLVGNSTRGGQGTIEPPYINGVSGLRYDSVNSGSNAIVVIFHDTQAYPEYLIKF